MVVCNLYEKLCFILLQTKESAARSDGTSRKESELGRNLYHCVHNSETKLIQNWVIYMRIYW